METLMPKQAELYKFSKYRGRPCLVRIRLVRGKEPRIIEHQYLTDETVRRIQRWKAAQEAPKLKRK